MATDRPRSVLIFGGAGFIGCNWAQRLLETTGATVHIVDNLSRRNVRQNLEWLQQQAHGSNRLQVTVGDVRDAAVVERSVRFATEIYHFAAQVAVTTSVADPRFDFDVNLAGTFNILEAVRRAGTRPFLLFTSTNKVYGEMAARPLVVTRTRYRYADGGGVAETQPLDFHSPYGCSKGAADQYVRDFARLYDIPAVVFRMSCVAGERQFGTEDQGWLAHFLYSAVEDQPVTIYGNGRQVRDILYVGDLLRSFELVRENLRAAAGQVYNVGGGTENTTSLLELMDDIEAIAGRRPRYRFDEMRSGDQLIYVTDHGKLSRDTGWVPQTGVRETLAKVHAWYLRNRELLAQASALPVRPAVLPALLPRTA